MNRPHVAALLRKVAAELAAEAYAELAAGDPPAKADAAHLLDEVVAGLRVRAGEIEAGG